MQSLQNELIAKSRISVLMLVSEIMADFDKICYLRCRLH